MQTYDNIYFDSSNESDWLYNIAIAYTKYRQQCLRLNIMLSFSPSINRQTLGPLHLVTLACLIHYLDSKGYIVSMDTSNTDLYEYIFNDLDFAAYWSGGKNHVNANSSANIFNLWRIIESEKDLYAKNVEEYFKRKYFKNKDLSAISVSLVEAFYNVFDHAHANGNAFSIIFYNEEKQELSYAVADFGIGIPTSVKGFIPSFKQDTDAIIWALKDNATVKSTSRNKGFGMSNILSAASQARIISNHGLIHKTENGLKPYHINNFSFPGTLIYLTVNMTEFEDEEVLESFNL